MNLKEIRKQLPHGAIRKIAARVNISEGTVSRVFNEDIDSSKKPEILCIAAEIIQNQRVKEREANEALQKAITA